MSSWLGMLRRIARVGRPEVGTDHLEDLALRLDDAGSLKLLVFTQNLYQLVPAVGYLLFEVCAWSARAA